jgi:hypothetical protein
MEGGKSSTFEIQIISIMRHLKKLLIVATATMFVWGCAKEKSFEIPKGSQTQWEFQEGGKSFKGPIDTAFIETFNSVKYLTIEGRSEDNKDKLTIEVIATDIKPGTYKTPVCTFTYLRNNDLLYQNNLVATDSFAVIIDRVDSTGISGSFNGKVLDSAGAIKTINNGRFSAKFKNTTIVIPPVSTDGKLMLWSNRGCAGNGPIDVSVAGKNGQITSFPATEPANCGDPGAYTVSLPAGTYLWKAKCGTDSIAGSATIAANGCTKALVDFAAPRTTGQLTIWSKKGCGTGNGPISVTLAGVSGQITTFTATEPATCGTAGTYTLTLPLGSYTWKAKCGTDSVSGQSSVTLNGCTKAEVVFGTTPPTPTGDYFPTTANSNWSYELEGGAPDDTLYDRSTGTTKTFGLNTYTIFQSDDGSDLDTGYYRKGNGIYYEYLTADQNPFEFILANPGAFENIILKDNVAANSTWETTITGTSGAGQSVTCKIKSTLTEKAASVTVAGTTYLDVLKVKAEYQVTLLGTTQTITTLESWYGKGKGNIKQSLTSSSNPAPVIVNLKRSQIF